MQIQMKTALGGMSWLACCYHARHGHKPGRRQLTCQRRNEGEREEKVNNGRQHDSPKRKEGTGLTAKTPTPRAAPWLNCRTFMGKAQELDS